MGNMYRAFHETDTIPAASIPAKYQRVAITNQEKKGFSSQARRFLTQDCLSENPGPGSYGCISSAELKSPSYSKRGTTGFVPSKAPRGSNPRRNNPGPNAYNLQSSFIDKHDFNIGVSRVFRLPVAVQLDGPKHMTPAPNQYDVSCGRAPQRFSSVVGTAAFLSKTKRESFCSNKSMPSPCHYEVRDHTTHCGSRAVLSSFKSKTQRIPAPVDHHVPGPGAYSPHQTQAPVKRTILPRGFYLALAAPPLIVPKDPPLPGPGQYDIGMHKSSSKHPMPTAAFASKTERIPPKSQGEMWPGPGFYDPQILSKQSFFYNDSRVWIPV